MDELASGAELDQVDGEYLEMPLTATAWPHTDHDDSSVANKRQRRGASSQVAAGGAPATSGRDRQVAICPHASVDALKSEEERDVSAALIICQIATVSRDSMAARVSLSYGPSQSYAGF